MDRRALILLGLLALGATPAFAAKVVVTPVDSKDVEYAVVRDVNRVVVAALREIPKLTVLESRALTAELGINLAEQVHDCNKDVLCLVQIGEAAGADQLLLTELSPAKPNGTVLKQFVVDVKKAAMTDTLRWILPAKDGAVDDGVPAAIRHLFAAPDARVIFQVMPKDAELRLYGEVTKLEYWQEVPFWSGVYYAQITGRGHDSREVRFHIPPGGPTRIVIELEQDPLYVDPNHTYRPPTGSENLKPEEKKHGRFEVVTADPDPIQPRKAPTRSAFSNWIAWTAAGVGVAASATGIVLMRTAQGSYNTLSAQLRFAPTTRTVAEATAERASDQSRYSAGGSIAIGGAALAGAAILYMAIDSAISDDSGGPPKVSIAPTIGDGGGGLACALGF
ncbi:MAG: hypothetical protein U1E65_05055 [Myxococcota bacterium]